MFVETSDSTYVKLNVFAWREIRPLRHQRRRRRRSRSRGGVPSDGKPEVYPAAVAYDAEDEQNMTGTVRINSTVPQLPVNRCDGMWRKVLSSAATDDHISHALREHLALLSPQQVPRRAQPPLGLQQKEFAEQIGVAAETISRWLSGTHIQSCSDG